MSFRGKENQQQNNNFCIKLSLNRTSLTPNMRNNFHNKTKLKQSA